MPQIKIITYDKDGKIVKDGEYKETTEADIKKEIEELRGENYREYHYKFENDDKEYC